MEPDLEPTDAHRRRWRRPQYVVAGATVVLVLAVVAVALGSGDDDPDLATGADPAATEEPTTTEGPEVLGDRVVRDTGGDDGSSTDGPATDEPSTTEPPAPAPGTAPAPAPAPGGPVTTEPACVRSTDPACGPFRWEPAPVNQPATLTVHPPSGPIVAGAPVSLRLEMADPDGPVTLACYAVNLDRPGLATGTCVAEPIACPERYGPWPPPPPAAGHATTDVEVRFDEAGTYVVTVDVSPPAGCDQVDPYRSGATTSITVEVQPA